jgi:hypothetical protein
MNAIDTIANQQRHALRLAMIANGYPITLCTGKAPLYSWRGATITPDNLADFECQNPDATNTGASCGSLVAMDVDIRDTAHAAAIEALITEHLGPSPMRRVGSKGYMLFYRKELPAKKISIVGSGRVLVEFLGDGQQCALFGKHLDTGKDYSWGEDWDPTPETVPLAELPEVTTDQLRSLAAAIAAKCAELGYQDVQVRDSERERAGRAPSPVSGAPVDPAILRAALSYLDPDAPYPKWRDIVAAIGSANCPEARQIAHEWSEGRLDRHGRYSGDEQ